MSNDESDSRRDAATILRLLPLHDVATTATGEPAKVHRRKGRPRKIELRPSLLDLEHHAAVAADRERFIDADELVTALGRGESTRAILRILTRQIVREAAALEFQRGEVERRGRDGSQISSRRIDALKKVADIEIKLRELEGEAWNLASEPFQRLFALWVERLTAVARETLPPESLDVFLNRLATSMANWEHDASVGLGTP